MYYCITDDVFKETLVLLSDGYPMPKNAQMNSLPSLLRIILLLNRRFQMLQKWDAFSCKMTCPSVHHNINQESKTKSRYFE